jgi:cytochrome c nitrite reductase small subunit
MINPWKMAAVVAAGIATGLGVLVAVMSEAHSYLSDRSEVCVNCHIMRPQYATWKASAHHAVATCNDCHVPHDTLADKYRFKAEDGLRHSAIFTLRCEPQVIRIRDAGRRVVQHNCLRCHGQMIDATAMGKLSFTRDRNPRPASAQSLWEVVDGTLRFAKQDPARLCIDCHRETPHGRVSSLSSAPEARIDRLHALGGSSRPPMLGQQLLGPPSPKAPHE